MCILQLNDNQARNAKVTAYPRQRKTSQMEKDKKLTLKEQYYDGSPRNKDIEIPPTAFETMQQLMNDAEKYHNALEYKLEAKILTALREYIEVYAVSPQRLPGLEKLR